jgi:hypothetical protein
MCAKEITIADYLEESLRTPGGPTPTCWEPLV